MAAVLFAMTFVACSPTKYVPEGQYLLHEVEINTEGVSLKDKNLDSYLRQQPNFKVFSFARFHLGLYNLSGKDSTKWINRTLRSMGEAPTIYDPFLTFRSEQELQKLFKTKGYMNATVKSEVSYKKKKAKVTYTVTPGRPYLIRNINYNFSKDSVIDSLFRFSRYSESKISSGMPLDFEQMDGERDRITQILKRRGYYYFNKDYFSFVADTTIGNHEVDVTMNLKPFMQTAPNGSVIESPHKQYKIRNVNLLTLKNSNSVANELKHYDHIEHSPNTFIYFDGKPLIRPKVLDEELRIRPNQLYNDFLLNYHFDEVACQYLLHKGMDPEFVKYLSTYKWKGTMYAMPEGTVCYPNTQMVRIKCDAIGAILIETYLLQTMNFNSMITTKSTHIVRAAKGKGVMEFGGRRAQGGDASIQGARAAILGGCVGTANCLAEVNYGQPVNAVGTVAHAWIELFPSEFEAFKAFADIYPEKVSLLIDTYHTEKSGIINTIKLDNYLIEKYPDDPNKRVKSVRIDSGDLAYFSKKARKMLDEAGFTDATICASSDLDEFIIESLNLQGACIDTWGVGTNLITSKDCPAFGGVYKLAAIEENGTFIPKIKLSENPAKITNPGNKTVFRIYDKETGKIKADVIAFADETIDESEPLLLFDPVDTWKKTELAPGSFAVRELLVPVFVDGACVYESPSVMEIRDYCTKEKDTLWEETKRFSNPQKVFVDLSARLYRTKQELLDKIHSESRRHS